MENWNFIKRVELISNEIFFRNIIYLQLKEKREKKLDVMISNTFYEKKYDDFFFLFDHQAEVRRNKNIFLFISETSRNFSNNTFSLLFTLRLSFKIKICFSSFSWWFLCLPFIDTLVGWFMFLYFMAKLKIWWNKIRLNSQQSTRNQIFSTIIIVIIFRVVEREFFISSHGN